MRIVYPPLSDDTNVATLMSTTLGKQHAHHAVMPIMLKWVYSGRDLAAYEYSAFHAELSLVYMPIMLNCLRFTR